MKPAPLLQGAALGLIRAYQFGVRPMLGPRCRFFPSCSDYAAEAITTHGVWRGSALAARRLGRCHPWHPGGFDPVPDRERTAMPPSSASLGDPT